MRKCISIQPIKFHHRMLYTFFEIALFVLKIVENLREICDMAK